MGIVSYNRCMHQVTVKAVFAKNVIERMTGLIGKHQAHGLVINTRFGIHTFGLKFPIDVLILDNEGHVRALKKELKPHSVYFWNPMHSIVLELPNGTIEENSIHLGSKIDLTIEE